ncbi:hypothetical protein TRFO_27040 [Tritrichomonas foetus]|uniref:HECT-type E3 ubiquitin transferase n=1 Tax=Tritrichomonas foetus TaxID=1144522 RepID=A0A1J4K6E8_9EUKA|nr:hypothetical protein TRFO_27040 [Tritrichomonas foetus]|eukprot:OHT05278.1 hypothetical protein TRFO_27040 [Tritrichomonas foetus]
MSSRGSYAAANRFSPAAYKRIINDIKTNSPGFSNTKRLDGLEKLAETLAFAEPTQLRNFPTTECCKEIVKIIQNSNDLLILTLSTQCIVNLLESIPDSQKSIVNANYISIAKEKIVSDNKQNSGQNLSKSIIENIIHSFCTLTKYRAKEIGQNIGVKFILDNFERINTAEKHYASIAMSKFTSYFVAPRFAKSLPVIAGYFASNDEIIANYMIDTFTNILNSVDFSDIPLEVAEVLSAVIICIESAEVMLRVIELLQRLTFNKKFAEAVIDNDFNFAHVLLHNDTEIETSIALENRSNRRNRQNQNDQDNSTITENESDDSISNETIHDENGSTAFRNNSVSSSGFYSGSGFRRSFSGGFGGNFGSDYGQIRRAILLLIRSFLPVPDFPVGFWESDRAVPDNSEKFASFIQKLLIELALDNSGDLDLIFVCLAMSLQLSPCEVPHQLFPLMVVTSTDTKLAPFVLLLALSIPNKQAIGKSGLVSHLSMLNITNPIITQWFSQKMTVLRSFCNNPTIERPPLNSFESFNEIFKFIDTTDISSFELHASGYINKFLELLKKKLKEDKDAFHEYDFSNIVNRLHQLITYTNIPDLLDPFEAMSPQELSTGTIIVDIKYNNKLYKHKKFENTSLMVAIEAWYNETVLHVTTNDLLNAARHSGRFGQLISLENAGSINYTHIGLLHRAFGTKRYRRFSFKMDLKTYSANDYMFQAIARNLPTPEYWPLIVPEIELINEELNNITELLVPSDKIPIKPIFELLKMIHNLKPSLDIKCLDLENALYPHLMSFFLDIGLFSPAIQISYHYPFLFSFEFRSFVFRMIASDFYSSLSFAQKTLFNNSEKLRNGRIFNHCTIHRNSLFDDGFLLMNKIASGPLQFDISFDNEAGFGIGPTKEFLSLFAKELTHKSHKMWRTDDTEREYSWTKIGLFPFCNADPELFYVFGILCAKAINMNTVLPIPLSVEFFKFIRGDRLTMADIDQDYDNALKNHEGLYGLTFLLPGTTIELKQNGGNIEVDESNVNEFVKLVNEFTFGSELELIRTRFIEGFSTVFHHNAWNLLDAREWRRLIAGEDVSITMKDLKDYVEISHGYHKDSPQISMLFEVLTEFDNSQKSLFVKFITGSERLPIGGLASLQPQLAVAKRIDDSVDNPDDSLPSVMTCTNYFKLPPCSSKKMMKEKILKAITEGQGAFLLT